eukprot:c27563_g1_i2 orf=164-1732(+)
METAVLPPQDCLHSQHYRRIPSFVDISYPSGDARKSRTELTRSSSVQSMMSFLPSEYASQDLEASVRAVHLLRQSAGLLPSPDRINKRHIPNSARSVMSTFSNPTHPSRGHSPPCKMYSNAVSLTENCTKYLITKDQSLPSRSSSATSSLSRDLNNDNSSGRRSLHSSTGRRPFKLVQGSAVAPRAEIKNGLPTACLEQVVNVTKFPDSRSGNTVAGFDDVSCRNVSYRTSMNGCDVTGEIKRRTHGDFLPKKCNGDKVDFSMAQSKNEDAKQRGMKGQAEKSWISQNNYEGEVKPLIFSEQPPRVTILQRPKTMEAARELLGRFEWNMEGSTSVQTHGNDGQNQNKEAFPLPAQKDNALLSCLEVSPIGQVVPTTLMERVPSCGSKGNDSVCIEAREQRTTMTDLHYGRDLCLEGDPIGELNFDEAAMDENWAGPAYSISPPPSCLPLPTFSLRQLRTSKEQCVDAEVVPGDPRLLLPSALACRQFTIIPTHRPVLGGGEGQLDLASATKDLRRILNLGSC